MLIFPPTTALWSKVLNSRHITVMKSHRQTHIGLSRTAIATAHSWQNAEVRWEVSDAPSLFPWSYPVLKLSSMPRNCWEQQPWPHPPSAVPFPAWQLSQSWLIINSLRLQWVVHTSDLRGSLASRVSLRCWKWRTKGKKTFFFNDFPRNFT